MQIAACIREAREHKVPSITQAPHTTVQATTIYIEQMLSFLCATMYLRALIYNHFINTDKHLYLSDRIIRRC